MQPERFRRLETLFHQLVELPPDRRERLLDRECSGAPDLRRQLEAMLRRDADLGDPSAPPPPIALLDPLEAGDAALGPYRIKRLLARGGMGVVFEAEQREPIRRSVALKLIRSGMDSRQVIGRFEMERQALALMDHPCVARVFDAGVSDDGRPYFAMELVEGTPITEYCEREKLSLRSRLELFAEVCDAVQHAHQKGVIHRDLKPSNVLVRRTEGRPSPKVIDFGVAKAIDASHEFARDRTVAGDLVGTPEYMSPEQAEPGQRNIDTRSDVYSLGVLLYELLTGCHPYLAEEDPKHAIDEVLRRVRSVTPVRPSARLESSPSGAETAAGLRLERGGAVRRLRGDLDWIVLRAMDKERERRYDSAADLAADVRRHLRNEPVEAGPPTRSYRVRKFVARHRAGVVVSSLLVLSLVGGVVGVSVALVSKARAERQAQRDAEVAQRTAEFLLDVFHGANLWQVGSETPTVLEVTDRAAERLLEDRTLDPEVRAALMRNAGMVYISQSSLDKARPLLEGSVELYRDDPSLRRVGYGRSLMRLAQLDSSDGQFEDGIRLAAEAERIIAEVEPDGSAVRATAASILGANLINGARRLEAVEPLTRAVSAYRRLGPEYESQLAAALINLAQCTTDMQRAEGLATEATELYDRSLPRDHPGHAEGPEFLAGQAYLRGDFAAAADYQGRSVEVRLRLLPPDHWNVLFPIRIHAAYLLFAQRVEEAREALRRSIEPVVEKGGEDDVRLGGLYNDMAFVELVAGEFAAAERDARRSQSILEAEYGRVNADVALTLHTLGDVLGDEGDHAAALARYDESRQVREALGDLDADPYAPPLFEAYARAHRRSGELERAREEIERAIALYGTMPFYDPRSVLRARMTRATLQALRGDAERAAESFDAAWTELSRVPGPLTMYDTRQLVLYHAVTGDTATLEAALRTALESGTTPRFLLTEPELRRRAEAEPEIAKMLTDDRGGPMLAEWNRGPT